MVSSKDIARLAAFLHLDCDEFVLQYTERAGEKVKIRASDTGYCIFFVANKGCRIHKVKPDVCRAWPFFRGNILDSASLHFAKDFCSGISPSVNHEDFARWGRVYLREQDLLASDPACEAIALILP